MALDAGTAYIRVVANTAGLAQTNLFSQLGGKMGGVWATAFVAAGVEVALASAIIKIGVDWAKAAQTARAATRLNFSAIRKDVDGVGFSFDKLNRFAVKYGESIGQTVVPIETMVAQFVALGRLKPFGGDTQKTAENFVKLTYDLATNAHKSVDSIEAIIKALANDAPTRALPTLQKMGYLTLGQVNHMKALVKLHKEHQASLEIIRILTGRVGGETAKNVTWSQKLSAKWANLKDDIGQKLVPILNHVERILARYIDKIKPFIADIHSASDAWKLFSAAAKFAFDTILFEFGGLINDMAIMFERFIGSILSVLGKIPGLGGPVGAIGDALRQFQVGPIVQGPPPTWHSPLTHTVKPHRVHPGRSAPGTATGGIVTAPQVRLVGEAGPEAIIPLGARGGMTVRITDSNLGLVMTGVLEDDKAFADRSGRAQR